MAATLYIGALSARVAVEFDDSVSTDDMLRFESVWADARVPAGGCDASVRVVLGTTFVEDAGPFDVAAVDFERAVAMLSNKITLAAIEHSRGDLVMLHACGVATAEGDVFAFVGPSGRGKTTLVSKLAKHWGYVTDETVGIELDGEVRPYRKPLSQVSPSGTKTQTSPSSLSLLPLPVGPLKVAEIVVLDRLPGWHGAPEIRVLPLVEALTRLVPEMSYLAQLRSPLTRLAELITRLGGVKLLHYQEAEAVTALLPDSFQIPALAINWESVDPEPDGVSELAVGMVRRKAAADALQVGDTLVLLNGTMVRVIEGIGPTIWHATRSAISLPALTAVVEERFGKPEGAEGIRIVNAVVDELVGMGILQLGRTE